MSRNTVALAVACVLVMVAVAEAQAVYVGSHEEGRVKRQAPAGPPPMWMELRGCCKIPMVIDPKSRAGCCPNHAAGTPPPTPVAGVPRNTNHSCAVECAYRNQTLLNAAGTVDSGLLSTRLTALATADPKWTAAVNAAIATCITPGLPKLSPTSICKSGALEAQICINNQLYQKCPDSARTQSARCTDILARAATARSG